MRQFLSNLTLGSQSILGLTMAVTSFVTGCFAGFPVKTDRPSHSFDVDYVKTHSQSTQQELVQQLGVPGSILRSGKETYYVYKAAGDLRAVAGIVLIVPPYFVPFFTKKLEGEALHCLSLVFDENGLLQGYKTATGSEQAFTGAIMPTGLIDIPLGKEETDCIPALWNDEEIRSLQTVVQFKQPEPLAATALAAGKVDSVPLVAAADRNHTVNLWDVRSDCLLDITLDGHEDLVTTIAFGELDSAPIVITGSADQTVRVWDARTGDLIYDPLRGHAARITLAAILEVDGLPTVFSGAEDHTVRMWDARTGQQLGELEGLLLAVAEIGGEPLLITSNFDHSILLRTLRSGRWQVTPLIISGSVPTVVTSVSLFEVDGRPMLATGSQDGAIRRWDTHSGKQLGNTMWGHQQPVTAISFDENGTVPVLLSVDATNTLRRWNVSVGGLLSESVIYQEGSVVAIRLIDVNGQPVIAASTGDHNVQIWDDRSGSQVPREMWYDAEFMVPGGTEILKITDESGDAQSNLQLYWNTSAPDSLKWLCRAAMQGNPEARYRLGLLYEHGKETVKKDYVKAYQWYTLSADVGDVWGGGAAGSGAKRMAGNLTSEQLAEGERFIAESARGQCVIETVVAPETRRTDKKKCTRQKRERH